MSRLSKEQTDHIQSQLREAGASLPCPRCGNGGFEVLDGYLLSHAQSQLRNMTISGDNRVACAATVCRRCGYLAQHVIDVLGAGRRNSA